MSPARYPLRHSACFMTIGVETKNFYPCKARVQKKTLFFFYPVLPPPLRGRAESTSAPKPLPPLAVTKERARERAVASAHTPHFRRGQRARASARERVLSAHPPLSSGRKREQVSEGRARQRDKGGPPPPQPSRTLGFHHQEGSHLPQRPNQLGLLSTTKGGGPGETGQVRRLALLGLT